MAACCRTVRDQILGSLIVDAASCRIAHEWYGRELGVYNAAGCRVYDFTTAKASNTHPIIKHRPPIGVMAPRMRMPLMERA